MPLYHRPRFILVLLLSKSNKDAVRIQLKVNCKAWFRSRIWIRIETKCGSLKTLPHSVDQCCGSETVSIRIRIRPAVSFGFESGSKTFIYDSDPTKSYGSLWIRTRNSALNRYQIPGKPYKYGTVPSASLLIVIF
jgi:hypothetical protein